MYSPCKKLIAQLLLFSFLLESCHNPNIGISKQSPPTPAVHAYKQGKHQEQPCAKQLDSPMGHTCTTADDQAINFTYQDGLWQAEVYRPDSSLQYRQLPIELAPGYTLEDLAAKDPIKQRNIIHICTKKYNNDKIDYIYIGKEPPQAEGHEQLLSTTARRQPALEIEATIDQQPKQVEPSIQQSQEEPDLQAVPSPWQATARGVDSRQLLTRSAPPPARDQLAQKQSPRSQQAPSRRTLSLRDQNELLDSQRVAQGKRTERIARNKPTDKPAPTVHLKQNTPPTTPQPPTPTPPPSLEDKTPQDIANPIIVAQGGHYVHFMHKNDQWQASVRERIGAFSRTEVLPVYCERHGDIAAALRALQGKPDKYVQQRIHVITARQIPYVPKFVFIGEQSLKGGEDSDAEPSGSAQSEPPAGADVGATGSGQNQEPSVPQDPEVLTVTLQRMDQGDITSTEALVQAFNQAQTAEEQQNLQPWIQAYVSWFAQQPIETLTPALIREYTCLADIRADQAASRQLLASYFNSLCNKMQASQYGEKPLIEALEYTLQTIDSCVFEGNPDTLNRLGKDLLARLDSQKGAVNFSKETYPTHRSTLYALHQTLVLLKQIDPNRWDATQKQGLYSQFRAQVQAIAETAQYYYPICYHAQLLKQGLKRLEVPGLQARLQEGLRRAGQGLQAGFYFYQAARALAVLDLEVNTLVSGTQSLQATLTSQHIKAKPWYDALQQLNQSCLSVLEDGAQYASFRERLEALKGNKAIIRKEKYRKALRYGVVQQLSLLALEGPTTAVRQQSTAELNTLIGSWSEDGEVREALLESLGSIAMQSQVGPQASSAATVSLFASIRDSLLASASVGGQAPSAVPMPATAVQEGLKSYYQEANFAQVRSLFDGEAPKHVETLQCQLMLVEQVKEKEGPDQSNKGQGSAPGGRQDQLSTHHERLQQVKTPIDLGDLFKKRSVKPGEAAKEIDKVLLVGEAGTGKTTLSRKLANSWAQGTWGQEFEAVYVLPVRELQKSQYSNASLSLRGEETLPTAIASKYFAAKSNKEYKRFRQQISQELGNPTTLVVLDGLDERYGASEELLSQAKAGRHKLLMLSRPYGIEAERPLADIEVEHAGFNDAQMEAFITDELSDFPKLGEELLSFIGKQPAIGSVAHVPVNLQILCALWKDDSSGVRAVTRHGSLPALYRILTGYTCDRYEERQRKVSAPIPYENREELFDTLGEIALYGLEQGEVLLSQRRVNDILNNEDGRAQDMLKDAGFLLLQDLGRQYQFPHLTFQEYFAGRWLAKQFLSGDASERRKVGQFLTKHKYERQYGVTLSFMAGEVSKRRAFEGIKQLLELLDAEPREVAGVQHVLLQVRLLHEFLCVVGEDAAENLAELEGEFHVLESLKDWFGEGLERVRRGGYWGDVRKLLELLTSGLQDSRAVAAEAPGMLDILLKALKDSDRWVRRAAVEALGELVAAVPGEAPGLREPLLQALKDDDRIVRRAAVSALVKLVAAIPAEAPGLLEALLQACKDEDYEVRSAAREALEKLVTAVPAEAPGMRDVLLQALKDEDYEVRRAAVSALGELVTAAPAEAPSLREVLLQALKDSKYWVRRAAVSALKALVKAAPGEAPGMREGLLQALKDRDDEVRSAALEALGEVVAVVPAEALALLEDLLQALKDEDYGVCSTAIEVLGTLVKAAPGEAPSMREDLLKALKDRDYEVRSAAIWALKASVKAAPGEAPGLREDLLQALKDSDDEVRSAALEALLQALKDEDKYVRSAAVEALGEVVAAAPAEAPGIREVLLQASKDNDSGVRSAAVKALGEVVAAAPAEAPGLREDLLKALKDEGEYIRRAAVSALGKLVAAVPAEAPDLREDLLKALKDEGEYVRRAAVSALGKLVAAIPAEAPGMREALFKALKDEDKYVRYAAREALEKFSIQQLIDSYWATKNQAFIPLFASQLYHVPLTIRAIPGKPNHQRLVLYPTAGESVPWDKPHEEVAHFVELIKREAKQGTAGYRSIY